MLDGRETRLLDNAHLAFN